MQKKIIIIIVIVILIVLFFPIRYQLKDGGTAEYRAISYKISKVHRLNVININEEGKVKSYEEGIIIEILGFEIYNNVK